MAQTLFSSKNERMNKENCNKHKKEMESSYSSQYSFLNWSTTRRAKALKVGRRESCSSTNCFYAQYLHSSLYKMQNVYYKGSTNKNWYFQEYFLNTGGGGSRIPELYVKFWWPLFLALKTLLFWPKVTFGFLNVPKGEG